MRCQQLRHSCQLLCLPSTSSPPKIECQSIDHLQAPSIAKFLAFSRGFPTEVMNFEDQCGRCLAIENHLTLNLGSGSVYLYDF